ncbi:MAG: chitosanase [Betaproteobacteria bacterium]|nr:chitosanase [Betaproteobacteria bacterium]MBP6187384.1 peptidoglycan-binding protein [Azonexus sp.]MBP6202032.1 peptidoglycan-binding protein [Azonexus sp.]
MLTPTQKQTAQSIVNLFETGAVLGEYGSVTVIPGDTGHLTFGRSQTTLGSGNLHDLLQRYCRNDGARFGHRLAPWLPRFAAVDLGLDNEPRLHNLLRATADDPVMRETQDQFFDEVYWQTAARIAANLGVTSALGTAVVYDSTVHGSWKAMRDRTIAQSGSIATLGEKKWIAAYVATRRTWLTKHPRSDLRKTAYRMDAFQRLIEQGYWGLELPLVVRGAEISSTTLRATPPGCYDGPQPGTRTIALQSPLARGLDVRLLQLGLSEQGVPIKADGIFGQTSAILLKQFQAKKGLPPTGVADAILIGRLVD